MNKKNLCKFLNNQKKMKVLSRYFTRLGILIPLILLSTIITGYENPNQPEKEKPNDP